MIIKFKLFEQAEDITDWKLKLDISKIWNESIYDDEFFKVNLKTLLASGIIAERNLLEAGLLPFNWIGSKGPHKDQLKKGMKKLTKEQRNGKEKVIDSRKKKTK